MRVCAGLAMGWRRPLCMHIAARTGPLEARASGQARVFFVSIFVNVCVSDWIGLTLTQTVYCIDTHATMQPYAYGHRWRSTGGG